MEIAGKININELVDFQVPRFITGGYAQFTLSFWHETCSSCHSKYSNCGFVAQSFVSFSPQGDVVTLAATLGICAAGTVEWAAFGTGEL